MRPPVITLTMSESCPCRNRSNVSLQHALLQPRAPTTCPKSSEKPHAADAEVQATLLVESYWHTATPGVGSDDSIKESMGWFFIGHEGDKIYANSKVDIIENSTNISTYALVARTSMRDAWQQQGTLLREFYVLQQYHTRSERPAKV
jgi:hypothetical protein